MSTVAILRIYQSPVISNSRKLDGNRARKVNYVVIVISQASNL